MRERVDRRSLTRQGLKSHARLEFGQKVSVTDSRGAPCMGEIISVGGYGRPPMAKTEAGELVVLNHEVGQWQSRRAPGS